MIAWVLDKGHYSPAVIDDNFSKGVFKEFIDALDPSRRFFIQSDIDDFKKYEFEVDNMIKTKIYLF